MGWACPDVGIRLRVSPGAASIRRVSCTSFGGFGRERGRFRQGTSGYEVPDARGFAPEYGRIPGRPGPVGPRMHAGSDVHTLHWRPHPVGRTPNARGLGHEYGRIRGRESRYSCSNARDTTPERDGHRGRLPSGQCPNPGDIDPECGVRRARTSRGRRPNPGGFGAVRLRVGVRTRVHLEANVPL